MDDRGYSLREKRRDRPARKTAAPASSIGIGRRSRQCFTPLAAELGLQRLEMTECQQLIRLETGSEKYAVLEARMNFPDFDVSAVAFGKADWERYFGDVGEEPPLPDYIRGILQVPCPFWPGKRVHDTHLLTLLPKTVDGRPLTLNGLKELIQRPRGGGHAAKYRSYDYDVKKEFGDQGVGRACWVLMTKNVLDGSRGKDYDEHRALMEKHAQRTGLPYEMPHALEAAVSILMHHAKTGKKLYAVKPWTFTRCQEKPGNMLWLGVGGFSARGLDVSSHSVFDLTTAWGVSGSSACPAKAGMFSGK